MSHAGSCKIWIIYLNCRPLPSRCDKNSLKFIRERFRKFAKRHSKAKAGTFQLPKTIFKNIYLTKFNSVLNECYPRFTN